MLAAMMVIMITPTIINKLMLPNYYPDHAVKYMFFLLLYDLTNFFSTFLFLWVSNIIRGKDYYLHFTDEDADNKITDIKLL